MPGLFGVRERRLKKGRLNSLLKAKDDTMTSRERVLQALAHQPTDRAPADYGALPTVTDRLIQKLGVRDVEELLVALGVDMRRIHFPYGQADTGPDADGYLRTLWGAKRRDQDLGDGLPNYIPPFTEDSTVEEVHAHLWPNPDALDYSILDPRNRTTC